MTGARIGETLAAKWADFDLKSGHWTKPGATTKTRTDHIVVLNPPALSMLRKMRDTAPDDVAVFSGMTYYSVKYDWPDFLETAQITNFCPHDFRHSLSSGLLSAGLRPCDVGAPPRPHQPPPRARES